MKGEVKHSLFVDAMILNVDNSSEFTVQPLKLKKNIQQDFRIQSNIQKSITFI